METKICKTCGKSKPLSEFYGNVTTKDGHRGSCRTCCIKASMNWRKENLERHKEVSKKHIAVNSERYKEYRKQYYIANIEKYRKRGEKWKIENLERYRKIQRKAATKRRSTLKGKLSQNISCNISYSLKNKSKGGHHWENLVGYTLNDLITHLEKQFKDGMTWNKYMKGEIHIDHIIPISVFNFEKPEHIDFKKCWSLSNLQPLWAIDNMSKHAKINRPFQPSLAIGGII